MTNYTGVATDTPQVASIKFTSTSFNAVTGVGKLTATLSPTSVAANTFAEETFTVSGLAVGDFVQVNKPTAQAGLGIVGCRVSAANTLAITFGNFTASPIVPTASEVYTILVVR